MTYEIENVCPIFLMFGLLIALSFRVVFEVSLKYLMIKMFTMLLKNSQVYNACCFRFTTTFMQAHIGMRIANTLLFPDGENIIVLNKA